MNEKKINQLLFNELLLSELKLLYAPFPFEEPEVVVVVPLPF